ncbi:hypothetical protein MSL71_22930 [Desulfoluna butyratoxydans]|uniref:Uncharacterized protein n=2 Tax=Desulfoluna butyratoxydans TaxID=231438 RepID=A0A4U8YMB6_9BACT|nr:hypothetical protein MSL71_22930 [Desulfoluna butyratoxydans]
MRQVTTRTPAVRRGTPLHTESYITTRVSGITVWHPEGMEPEDRVITIGLEKKWIFRELVVRGVGAVVIS